jgi:hypothetical protein
MNIHGCIQQGGVGFSRLRESKRERERVGEFAPLSISLAGWQLRRPVLRATGVNPNRIIYMCTHKIVLITDPDRLRLSRLPCAYFSDEEISWMRAALSSGRARAIDVIMEPI